MHAHVDAASGRVRLGDREWRFALDCRTGGATVALADASVSLRPLRWREKVTLARFAQLGQDLVDDQLLLASGDGNALAGGGDRDALLALAVWLSAPDEDLLPLEPPLLSTVTLEVCRALGVAPGELDDRDAAEVEALWHATAPGGRVAAEQYTVDAAERDPSLTRIVIVDDEEPVNERVPAPRASTRQDGVRAAGGPPTGVEPARAEPAAQTESAVPEAAAAAPVEPAAALAPAPAAPASALVAPGGALVEQAPGAGRERRTVERFRVVTPALDRQETQAPEAPDLPAANGPDGGPPPRSSPPAAADPVAADVGRPRVQPVPPADVGAQAVASAPPAGAAHDAPAAVAVEPTASVTRGIEASAPQASVREIDLLIDELEARLAEAARELGVAEA